MQSMHPFVTKLLIWKLKSLISFIKSEWKNMVATCYSVIKRTYFALKNNYVFNPCQYSKMVKKLPVKISNFFFKNSFSEKVRISQPKVSRKIR